MNFQEIINFLFERKQPTWIPQIGMANDHKQALAWIPGKTPRTSISVSGNAVKYLGCTNRSYPDPYKAMHGQESEIVWCGIDIDGHDNLQFTTKELVDAVGHVTGKQASLRLSCGGQGLHVLFRLANPIPVPAYPARSAHSHITKQITLFWVEQLIENGVACCKWDSRMFWLWGGQNQWVYRTHQFLATPTVQLPTQTQPEIPVHLDGKLTPLVREWLEKLDARPGLVYVGNIVKKLRALGETVKTKSGCSGDQKPNGYLDVVDGVLSLWTYADGCVIWRVAEDML